MIYPESRGDYYSKHWSETEFNAQLEILYDSEIFLGVTNEGFVRLSLVEKTFEIIKGLFGGTDCSTEQRIQAAWLKFLYYGEAHNFLKDHHLDRLQGRIKYSPLARTSVDFLFQELKHYHNNQSSESESNYLDRLRDAISNYHEKNSFSLRPGLWSRLLCPPILDPKKLFAFGDTPLQLSKKALKQDPPDPQLAFRYLQSAFHLKNDSEYFQEKLAEQLQKLNESYFSELKGHSKKIQELWILLAQTFFEYGHDEIAITYLEKALKADSTFAKGRLQIGKLYLSQKEYKHALPFLKELQKAYGQDLTFQTEIGHAYWEERKYPEAIAAYEAVTNQNKFTSANLPDSEQDSIKKNLAHLYHRIGEAYLHDLLPPSQENLEKARKFLTEAVINDPSVENYQLDLCEAYEEQWEAAPDSFAKTVGEDLLKFIKILDTNVTKKNVTKIPEILFDCSEKFFKDNQNSKAHLCLEEAFRLFPDQVDFKIDALDLTLRYNDSTPLQNKFEQWETENYANPYLKKKIGDAYWVASKDSALKAYENALALFSKSLSACSEDGEKMEYKNLMGEIESKIGQNHLQSTSGILRGVPYDQALDRLEKAANLNPQHISLFFDACLAAAKAEKERNIFFRNTNKIIDYYKKAFEALGKKGDYLIDLMQLCFDSKRSDDAINIYASIQKQTWSQELVIPAGLYNTLGSHLFTQKKYEVSLACLKQAHLNEPTNQQYKQDYFQLTLTLAENNYKKMTKKKDLNEEDLILQLLKLTENLEECWIIGFDKVETLKESYQDFLTQIYSLISQNYLQQSLIPQSADEYISKDDIKKHLKENKANIQQALKYYNEGLRVNPDSSILHFDKGLLLRFWKIDIDYVGAFDSYKLAVKLQPHNPYYHSFLAQSYFVINVDSENCNHHNALAENCGYPDFKKDMVLFEKEILFKEKSKEIDPHSYTQIKKSWF